MWDGRAVERMAAVNEKARRANRAGLRNFGASLPIESGNQGFRLIGSGASVFAQNATTPTETEYIPYLVVRNNFFTTFRLSSENSIRRGSPMFRAGDH